MQILCSSANIKPDTNVLSSPFKLDARWPNYVLLLQKQPRAAGAKGSQTADDRGESPVCSDASYSHIL